jgi:hypothetical protein
MNRVDLYGISRKLPDDGPSGKWATCGCLLRLGKLREHTLALS